MKGEPVIVSLFDYSGSWSAPYKAAGYCVYQLDLKRGDDLRVVRPAAIDCRVHGILMAPPCTDFASSGAQYWPAKDADGRTAASVALVRAALLWVRYHRPVWWCLENPVGRLNRCVPELAAFGPAYVQPYWFGDAYTKKTGLWGNFNRELQRSPVEPVRSCAQGSWVQRLGGASERTKELRSITPPGLARAFFRANP